jgi:hypothetical protein
LYPCTSYLGLHDSFFQPTAEIVLQAMRFGSLPVTSYLAKSGVWATSSSSLSGLVLVRLDSRQRSLEDPTRGPLLRGDARSDCGSDAGRLSAMEKETSIFIALMW